MASNASSNPGWSSNRSGPSSRRRRSYSSRRRGSPRARMFTITPRSSAPRRPRTFAKIMPEPPSDLPTPRAIDLLARLTTLAQELAGAFRPATVLEIVTQTLSQLLQPDRLCVALLDAETNRLAVTHDTSPVHASTTDPLLLL